jgi:hypothetical protein
MAFFENIFILVRNTSSMFIYRGEPGQELPRPLEQLFHSDVVLPLRPEHKHILIEEPWQYRLANTPNGFAIAPDEGIFDFTIERRGNIYTAERRRSTEDGYIREVVLTGPETFHIAIYLNKERFNHSEYMLVPIAECLRRMRELELVKV